MRAWYAECIGAFLARDPDDVVGRLSIALGLTHGGEAGRQIAAWHSVVAQLRSAAAQMPPGWTIALEYDLLRLEKRLDAVLLTDRAIFVLEFKEGAQHTNEDLAQVEDYALDLHDFHAASRHHPVVPVLVARDAPDRPFDWPLLWHGVAPPLRTNAAGLAGLLDGAARSIPVAAVPLDGPTWLAGTYRPVPTIVQAARRLFERNTVQEIAEARADAANLRQTTAAIHRALADARLRQDRVVVFVTGIPGAGKTLCGLNIVFGAEAEAGTAFLTGNAPLVAVLRGALEHDAASGDRKRARLVRRPIRQSLQNVHRFLDELAGDSTKSPPERVIVFDEAQRAWDEAQARRDTQRRRSQLTMSEPAHALDIMSRRPGWAAIVALIGNGQEINTGEAGLAEWGRVIAARGDWRALAAPRALAAAEPTQRLADGDVPWLSIDADLDLSVPVRSVRDSAAAAWVGAVLDGNATQARRIADGASLPMFLTRDLAAARAVLRRLARGLRRAGLVQSSGAKRLRAEGLGAVLAGDKDVVPWFLRRWPDVRASDALEVCATEFACQGLELDVVGVAWGGDLIRAAGGWSARNFAGTRWNAVHKPRDRMYVLNTYRVLLTRARYETIIWVPPGDDADRTRPRAEMDAIADFLRDCGIRELDAEAKEANDAAALLL